MRFHPPQDFVDNKTQFVERGDMYIFLFVVLVLHIIQFHSEVMHNYLYYLIYYKLFRNLSAP